MGFKGFTLYFLGGSDRKTQLQLYKSLVASKLAYECEVCSSATLSRLKMLDSVHHAGVKIVYRCF